MRIGFVSCLSRFYGGGSEYLWLLTAKRALSEGHEVAVSLAKPIPSSMESSAPKSPALSELSRAGAKLYYRKSFASSTLQRLVNRFCNPFVRLAKFNADVLVFTHAHAFDSCSLFGRDNLARLTRDFTVPYFINCQYNDDNYVVQGRLKTVAREFFANAAKVMVISEHNLRAFQRQLALPLHNTIKVFNPPNLSLANRSPLCSRETECMRLAFVGRLHCQSKGIDLLLQAMSFDIWRDREWRLTLYGKGPDRPHLESLVELYKLQDKVAFAGHVGEIEKVWAKEDLAVSPARAEGMPMTVVEAMLCGRPVVATDTGIARELIEDGCTGFLAEGCTAHSICAAIERAWLHRKEWPKIGAAARDAASALYEGDPVDDCLRNLIAAVN